MDLPIHRSEGLYMYLIHLPINPYDIYMYRSLVMYMSRSMNIQFRQTGQFASVVPVHSRKTNPFPWQVIYWLHLLVFSVEARQATPSMPLLEARGLSPPPIPTVKNERNVLHNFIGRIYWFQLNALCRNERLIIPSKNNRIPMESKHAINIIGIKFFFIFIISSNQFKCSIGIFV